MQRQTFTVDRSMDFFTEQELTTQIGYPKTQWAAVLLKELIDNSLDACENAGITPRDCAASAA